jgi:hypothetical protein
MPAVRNAAADQGQAIPTSCVFIRYRECFRAPVRALPLRCDSPPDPEPGQRDHGRPVHTGVERVVAKMGPSLPYRRARTLLSEFLPLDDIPSVETARQRTIRVGARLEKEAVTLAKVAEPTLVETKSIALSIDGGHVRSARQYQGRSFEVLLAQVTNDVGEQIVFSSVPAEAMSQRDQLRGVLHKLGATAATPATILSDGAEGPRALGEAASPGPTRHVLDWFHLSMRIQHINQATKAARTSSRTIAGWVRISLKSSSIGFAGVYGTARSLGPLISLAKR